jgi:hypothetical protein
LVIESSRIAKSKTFTKYFLSILFMIALLIRSDTLTIS